MRSTYIGTDREVRLGDRGACTVADGVPGVITHMWANDEGDPPGARGTIRWPNDTTENVYLDELHWVEPERLVELYLTDEWVERLLSNDNTVNTDHLKALAAIVRKAITQ